MSKGKWGRDWASFIRSEEWKAIRLRKIEAAGFKCERCGSLIDLQCHHRHYRKPFGEEANEDLEVLCEPCHREHHGMRLLPPKGKRQVLHKQRLAYWARQRAEKRKRIEATKAIATS